MTLIIKRFESLFKLNTWKGNLKMVIWDGKNLKIGRRHGKVLIKNKKLKYNYSRGNVVVILEKNLSLRDVVERKIVELMDKRGYWSGDEEADSEWSFFEGKDCLEISLGNFDIPSKEGFDYHKEVSGFDCDKVTKYSAVDCTREEHTINFEADGVLGKLKILFSEINYSYFHEAKNGKKYNISCFAVLEFKKESDKRSSVDIMKFISEVVSAEITIWETYRQNCFF